MHDNKGSLHPLPTKKSTIIAIELNERYKGVPAWEIPEKIAQDEVLNNYATRIEIRDDVEAPRQTRLMAADSIDKPIRPDKIEKPVLNQQFNVIQHINELVIKQTLINQTISKHDKDSVIDVTPESEHE